MFDSYTDDDLNCKGIYTIVNLLTGRVYIGMTMKCFRKRWASHLDDLTKGKHCNIDLQQDWDELDSGAFQWAIVHKFVNLHGCYQQAMETLERVMIVTAECWTYNATKRRLYKHDQDLIAWLYDRRFG